MRGLAVPQSKVSRQGVGHMRDLLSSSNNASINGLLVLFPLSRSLVSGLFSLEDLALVLALVGFQLDPVEVLVVDALGHGHVDVQLGGGGPRGISARSC